jgi:uncharacterized protein
MFLAFLTGMVGSLHCLGMCGPLVLALPFRNFSTAIIYNSGRILVYFCLGAVFGSFGTVFSFFGFQQSVSIGVGVFIISISVIPSFKIKAVQKFEVYFKHLFIPFFKKKNYFSIFMIGALNGLLPCGLVYISILGAIAMGTMVEGALYMALFGLGTLPVMILVTLSQNLIKNSWRKSLTPILPSFAILIGILFIIRGLNLGIPYMSPKIERQNIEVIPDRDTLFLLTINL